MTKRAKHVAVQRTRGMLKLVVTVGSLTIVGGCGKDDNSLHREQSDTAVAERLMMTDEEKISAGIARVLAQGGEIERAEDLPDKPIIAVELSLSSHLNDEDLAFLSKLPHLRRLSLANFGRLKRLDYIQNLKELRELNMPRSGLWSEHLLYLWDLKALERLDLSKNYLSTPSGACPSLGLRPLAELTNLQVLSLEETRINDDDLKHLSALGSLSELDASDNRISDEGLSHLSGLVSLKVLDVSRNRISDKGLAHLRRLTQLEELYLVDTKITGAGLEKLETLIRLRKLILYGAPVSGRGLAALADLPNLRELSLNDTEVSDADLSHLLDLKTVESLYLQFTDVTDEGIQQLTLLPNLQRLDVGGTHVTAEGISRLKSKRPELTVID